MLPPGFPFGSFPKLGEIYTSVLVEPSETPRFEGDIGHDFVAWSDVERSGRTNLSTSLAHGWSTGAPRPHTPPKKIAGLIRAY